MTTGFLYFSDDHRHGFYIEERGRFTDILPSEPKVEEQQIALVALDSDEIHFAAVMRRGRKAASLKWLVSFEAIEPFEPPLDIPDLINRLDPEVGRLLAARVGSRGSQLAQNPWTQVRDAIDSMQGDVNLLAKEQALVSRRPLATATAAWLSVLVERPMFIEPLGQGKYTRFCSRPSPQRRLVGRVGGEVPDLVEHRAHQLPRNGVDVTLDICAMGGSHLVAPLEGRPGVPTRRSARLRLSRHPSPPLT